MKPWDGALRGEHETLRRRAGMLNSLFRLDAAPEDRRVVFLWMLRPLVPETELHLRKEGTDASQEAKETDQAQNSEEANNPQEGDEKATPLSRPKRSPFECPAGCAGRSPFRGRLRSERSGVRSDFH